MLRRYITVIKHKVTVFLELAIPIKEMHAILLPWDLSVVGVRLSSMAILPSYLRALYNIGLLRRLKSSFFILYSCFHSFASKHHREDLLARMMYYSIDTHRALTLIIHLS